MQAGSLSALQQRILAMLAELEPRWTLVGGGALVGFHTRHRVTRDLDLFFRPLVLLTGIPASISALLARAGLQVTTLQSAPAFCRLEVRDEHESVVLDLVADPTPVAEPPSAMQFAGTTILVETPHQLLVNKLCALLSRSELRDLVDVEALLGAGADLERALADCPRQDAGFSPLTFAWIMRGFPLERLARVAGVDAASVARLVAFRDQLVDRVLASATPPDDRR